MSKKHEPTLLDVGSAAAFLGVSAGTIRRWAAAGQLKGKHVGSRGDWRFTKEDLSAMFDKKNKQTETIHSLTFLKHLADTVPGMVAVYNIKSGEYIYVNNGIRRLLGYSPNDFIKKGISFVSSLVHPEDLAVITEQNANALKKANAVTKHSDEAIVSFTYRMKHKNGTWRWLQTDGSVFDRDEEGKVLHVMNISIDVTERIVAEDKFQKLSLDLEKKVLLRSKELSNILESISDAFVALNDKWEYTYVNSYAERILGKSREELLGQNMFKVFPVARKMRHFKNLSNAKKLQKPIEYETYNPRLNIWLLVSINPAINGVSIFMHDITARKQSEEAQKKLVAIVESTDDAVYSKDMNGIITSWNKSAENFFGYTSLEILGQPVSVLMPSDKKDDFTYFMSLLKRGKKIERYETKRMAKNGEIIDVSVTISPIKDTKGKIIGASTIARNITYEKSARERLQASEELFRLLTTHAPVGIFLTNANGDCEFVNKKWTEFAGISADEAMGQGWIQVLHPEDKERIFKEWYKSAKEKRPFKATYRFLAPNGKVTWLDGSAIALHDSKKIVKGYIGTISDITENVIAREKLTESEERYKAFVSQSNEGIWRFELEKPLDITLPVQKQLDHVYKYAYLAECNDAMARMYGYQNANDIVGARLPDFMDRQDKRNIDYLTTFIKSGYKLLNGESYEKDNDGNIHIFQNNLIGIVQNKHVIRAWGNQRDITVHRQAEEALRQSEERYRYIFETAGVSLWDQDFTEVKKEIDKLQAKGVTDFKKYFEEHPEFVTKAISLVKINDVNQHTVELYEAESKEDLLNSLHKVFLPETSEVFIGELLTIAEGRTKYTAETVEQTLNGRVFHILFSIVFPKDEQSFKHVLVNIIDITDRKKTEQRKDDFIALASHELKTPVTSLKMYTQILHQRAKKLNNPDIESFSSKMNDQLNKLTNLVQDLLDVSRIQQGKLLYNMEKFNVKHFLDDTIDDLQRISPKHNLEIRKSTSSEILGDRDRLRQVIINLITNAIRYSPKSNKVIISSEKKAGDILISVKDFGIGIPKEQQEKIFDRFYQVEVDTTRTYPGLGLGLYISHEIMQRHNGKIWVESSLGEGSTFYISLPVLSKNAD
jgi:PAS domain S-box-containing protein